MFLRTIYVVVFIELGSRRLLFANCTANPDSAWVTQQARNVAYELEDLGVAGRFAIHDRDGYVMQALEIAAYSLLEQLAVRCGDHLTAEAAKTNLADEEEMSRKIAATWGDAIHMTLVQEGIES